MPTIGQRIVDGMVAAYQRHVSSGLNADNDTHCLYTPSCSAYAREAVATEGAFIGTLDAMGRLARCNGRFAERNRSLLIEAWNSPNAHVDYADDAAHSLAETVRSGLREGGTRADEAREILERRLHVAVDDRPRDHAQTHFTISVAHSRDPHARGELSRLSGPSQTPSSGTSATRRVLSGARRIAGTVVGGVVGGVVGAVAEGLLNGLVLAPVAALHKEDALRGWLTPRVGPQGAEALGAIAAHAARPAGLAARIPVIGPALGLAIGVPLGIVGGALHGAVFGAAWGARVGRAI